MNTLNTYWEMSQLAQASYIDLVGFTSSEEAVVNRFVSPQDLFYRFSDTQARRLISPSGYGVANIDASLNNEMGFSATLFKDNRPGGQYVLAFRGTEPFSVDATYSVFQISAWGVAAHQIVSMYNYFQRLITPVGEPVRQLQVEHLVTPPTDGREFVPIFDPSAPLSLVGYLALTRFDADNAIGTLASSGARINVTGHSLGGHLGQALQRLFPAWVDTVYAHNSAGFFPFNADAFFRLIDPNVSAFDETRIKNIFSYNGGEYITDTMVHTQYGQRLGILIEDQAPTVIGNHSGVLQARSLALHALFERIAPAFDTGGQTIPPAYPRIDAIIRAGAPNHPTTYEATLRSLVKLYLGEDVTVADLEDLETYYQKLFAVYDAIGPNSSATIDSLVDISSAQLAAIAGGSEAIAYRYALKELNPFAVIDTSGALYARFQSGGAEAGALDLYDPVNRGGTLTTDWITDRADFLAWKNQYFTTDGAPLRGTRDENYLFENRDSAGKTDLSLTVVGNLAAGGNSGASANPAKVVFGNAGTDAVTGGILQDRLYGDAGTDWLEGKGHNDYLKGGKGLDVYNYNAFSGLFGITGNDGADVIRDIDGKGVLRYTYTQSSLLSTTVQSTVIAEASVRISGLQWNSADGRFSYLRSQDDLVITIHDEAGGSITLKDFRDGDFGIHLRDARADPVITGVTITGDLEPQDFDESTPGIQTQNDALGNVIVTANPAPDREDVLNDSADNDRIIAGGGNDTLRGIRGGADWMSGDSGRDNLAGGAGADLLEGGADGVFSGEAGGDIVWGDLGNDEIYADAKIVLSQAITQGDSGAPSNAKGDYLSGGGGDDWIVGAAGDDYLDGGSGQDLIIGGAGSDNIAGDYGYVASSPLWVIAREVTQQADQTLHTLNFVSGSLFGLDDGPGAADVVYGGAGDDWIVAGAGDDFLDGGADNDKMWGEAGSDVLIGGTGNDLLVGDNPGFVTGSAEGGDYLDGGAGDDNLQGNGGNDVLIGGPGNDTLIGGTGKDIYVFNKGDGIETVFDTDADSISPDASVLVLGDGVARSDIKFKPGSLAVDIGPSDPADPNSPHDIIHFNGFDQLNPTATTPLGEIRFADGTGMSYAEILAQGFDIDGTEGNDTGQPGDEPQLVGTGVTDRIRGLGGNDVLFGLNGDDALDGGMGSDQMVGGAGTDQLEGGEGDDFLWGDEDGLAAVDQGADVMSGGAGNDYLQGYGGDDLMFGGAGSDTLLGQAGADYMEGGDGNDFLWGDDSIADQGNDTLDGGGGNDQLVGDAGNDTYVFGRGYGQDIVFDQDATVGNIDVVQFAADITPDDVTATQDPGTYNLRLSIDGTPDALIIANHYFSADDKVEEIRFADGTVWTPATIPTLILGSSGNDILNGTAGADVFKSGAGSDVMAGGAGNDSYRYYRGDGADYIIDFDTTAGNVDKIVFAADILPADVRATRSGNNLRLTLNALDFVVVEDYFVNDGVTPKSVEQVKFLSNGTVWDVNTIKQLVLAGTSGNDVLTGYASDDVLVGLGGNDTLTGNAGNDTLNGGTGNDVLQGGAGNDVYLFARGDGQDTITDTDSTAGNTDTLRFAADISPTDVLAQRSSDDLVLTVSGTTDQIAVSGHFAGDGTGATLVENVVFQIDATVWDYNTIKQKVLTGTDNADTVIGFETSDLINGNGGNDSLFGRGGNDTLLGGAGADALYGEAGDDDLDGGLDVTGTDTLTGGEGSDIYRFGRGAGATQIQDAGGAGFAGDTDVLLISADVAPADLQLRRTGVNSLEVRITGDPGVANLPAQFVSDGQGADSIERIQFLSDGTIWYGATINSIVSTATSGDDLLFGFNLQNDLIHGLGGNDTIYGSGGNDTLTGGTGNDILSGEAGGDTYVFSRGDGQDLVINATSDTPGSMDVLSFASDILPGDVTPARGGDDLVLTVSGGAGEVRIQNYFSGGLNVVEEIRFANGTVWNEQTILTFLPPPPPVRTGTEGNDTIFGDFRSELLRGLGGDDTIYGGGGNDTFQGGAGEDWQYGSLGDDTYLLDLGDGGPGGWFSGGDVISDSGGFDVLRFGPGISSAETPDITEFQSAYYGRYFALGVPSDTGAVYFLNYFTTGYIEEIRFEDGTVWNDQTLAPYLSIDGTNSSETLAGTRIADVIYGFGGADTIYGGQGHDTLDGGLGSDVLYGEDGNDTLISGVGEAKNATVSNSLYGGSGDDVLIGGGNAKSTERLDGGFGNDILLGASGSDYLYDTGSDGGNTLMYGAGGNDNLHMDSGSKGMAIGGVGRDIISGGLGAGTMNSRLIVAFNKNDGPDDVHLVAPGSTISMGGGTLYSNLSLEKLSGGLKLKTGTNHYVFLFDWYGSNPWDSRNAVTTLQIVIEGTRDYKPSSSNPMNNKKIQVFDFVGLAAAFDAAGRPSNFNVANNLANYRLWGSDTEAIGGAIAYQYARTGSISSLTYDQMRGVISAPEFAVSAQPITTSQTMSSATSETTESTDAMMLSASLALDSSETETSMAGSDDAVQVAPEELTNRSAEVLHRTTFSGAEVLSSPRAPAIPKSFEEAAAPAVITGRRVAFSGLPAQQDRRANPSYPAAIDAAEESTGVPAQPTGGAVRQARSGLIESDELVDPAAQAGAPLFDRLNAAPRFHFEALAEFFAAEANRRHATLSPAEVALRWSRVRAFTETLGMAGMDEDLGAGGSMLLPYGAGASEAGGEWSLPVRPAVGLAEGTAAQLRRFEGLQGAVRTLG